MAAVPNAVPSALPSALPQSWLSEVTTATDGPAQYGYPQADAPNPEVPTTDTGLPVTQSPVAPVSPGYLVVGEDGEWPVPTMYGLDAQGPVDRGGDGSPQGELETTAPQSAGSGFRNDSEPYQTYDVVAQSTDTHGWQQNVPNDRQSHRNTFGQWNPENNPTWWEPVENPVQAHLAISSPGFTSDPGAPGVKGFINGDLPDWTVEAPVPYAYETPSPPTGVPAPTQWAPDPAAGWA